MILNKKVTVAAPKRSNCHLLDLKNEPYGRAGLPSGQRVCVQNSTCLGMDIWPPIFRLYQCPSQACRSDTYNRCALRANPGTYHRPDSSKAAPLLDAEVGRPHIHVQVCGVTDGRSVAGAVPGCANSVHLRKKRRLRAGVMPPIWLTCMRMKSINVARDQGLPFARVVE